MRIEEIQLGEKYFHLKVYWDEDDTKEKTTDTKKKTEDKKKKKVRKEKTIEWNDINENVNGVRHACKALEYLNKRKRFLTNYIKVYKVS